MSLEMPFEMRNLTAFPMEKLCYDLKFEVLEAMDAKDTIELVKVNAGFQWMLSRNPSLVFNHHVNQIQMNDWQDGKIRIRKLENFVFDQIYAKHLRLSKRIHSCDKLWIRLGISDDTDRLGIRFGTRGYHRQLNNEHAAILNQLNSVRNLTLVLHRTECVLKFFDNFRSVIEESARILLNIDWLKENQVIIELFENFISNQLNDCEDVCLHYCRSAAAFHFYYDAFARTSTKILRMAINVDHLEEIVQSIVEKGIPSKNSKAAFDVYYSRYVETVVSQERKVRIVDFLSQFRGMKRFDPENHEKVIKMADELVNKYSGGFRWFPVVDGLFFRRNIDSSRDCIYMLPRRNQFNRFFAFYIEPQ